MVVKEFPNYFMWIGEALGLFALICIAAALLGLFFGYAVAAFRHGPFEAFYVVAQVVAEAFPDFLGTSLKRTLAMARLAVKEALRRRVILVTFGIFSLALLFGGWFMNAGSDKPDQIYVNFVLWGTQMLVLLVGLLISAFSLPDDIKNRTIFTIVTKPVRSTEIVLGRIIGFGFLGTVLLLLMGVISFLFVWRGLSHSHLIVGDTQTIESFYEIDPVTRLSRRGKRVPDNTLMEAETTSNNGHSHRIVLIEDIRDKDDPILDRENIFKTIEMPGNQVAYHRLVCEPAAGHRHRVFVDGEGDDARIRLGPAIGFFRSRVPIYADTLYFYDRDGKIRQKGIDIGREWQYRGYVDGGSLLTPNSLSKALFQFDNFTEDAFGGIAENGILPLEMTLGVFRTYKGDIEQRVIASYQFESVPDNPEIENKFQSDPINFETSEFTIQTLSIPRKIKGRILDPEGAVVDVGEYDLFNDFAGENQKLKLSLACEEYNQYIGVARADLYFRARDSVYWLNFLKGYLGIWCQMMIIISLGVALSTFLSAPVVIIGTMSVLVLGFFSDFIRNMTDKDASGGGPLESFYRLVTQKNMEVVLEPGLATTVTKQFDFILVKLLSALTYLAPDFARLSFADFLTHGYSVDIHRILVAISITLAFCVGLSILGYFSLKTREIAK